MWITEKHIRPKSILHLQYIIVTKEHEPNSIFPPAELQNPFLHTIGYLPKTLAQLDDKTTVQIANEWMENFERGYDVSVVFEQNLEYISETLSNRQIAVVFIDADVNTESAVNYFVTNCFTFYYFSPKQSNGTNSFSSSFELINLFRRDKDKLSNYFQGQGLHIQFQFDSKIPDDFKLLNRYDMFIPSRGNFLMLNQYIGNLWHDQEYISEIENSAKNENEYVKELKRASGRRDRMNILIDQIKRIDRFRSILAGNQSRRHNLGDSIAFYTPLVIISPFQYPKISEVLPNLEEIENYKSIKETFRTEQDIDYRNNLDPSNRSRREIFEIMSFTQSYISTKMEYLDNLGYLHASFTYSPIFRLPLKGKSLSRHLSIFDPQKPLPGKKKFFDSVKSFGEHYVSSTLNQEAQKLIIERNRQLIFISDLPVEWFNLGGVSLSFTHDTTRLPEIPYSGLMASYVKNLAFRHVIPEGIISKTLVIFGAPTNAGKNQEFEIGYRLTERFAKEVGFFTSRCNSIEDLKLAVERHTPYLLIFDTHGKADNANKTSLLQIGTEWLSGDDIVEYGISAPLIVLSACNTVPNWGYLNPITNAFFEVGCLSITGTFLPIGIISGTTFYLRLLRNLHYAADKGLHNNWLNFIGHNIRSQYLVEIDAQAVRKAVNLPISSAEKKKLIEKIKQLTARLVTMSMAFTRRREIFREVFDNYNSLHPRLKIDQLSLPFEQLLYSNLGRGDLMYFQSWLTKAGQESSNESSDINP